jgi:hypothetical protein
MNFRAKCPGRQQPFNHTYSALRCADPRVRRLSSLPFVPGLGASGCPTPSTSGRRDCGWVEYATRHCVEVVAYWVLVQVVIRIYHPTVQPCVICKCMGPVSPAPAICAVLFVTVRNMMSNPPTPTRTQQKAVSQQPQCHTTTRRSPDSRQYQSSNQTSDCTA